MGYRPTVRLGGTSQRLTHRLTLYSYSGEPGGDPPRLSGVHFAGTASGMSRCRRRSTPLKFVGTVTLAGLLAIPCLPRIAPGGPEEPPPELTFSGEVGVPWVLVPVVVRSPGGFVNGLTAKDFQLSVDGTPVPIASFESRSDAPLSVVFLQDLSGSMESGGKLDTSRRAVRCLLDRALPGDEFAIATFSAGHLHVEVPFTSELQVLGEAVEAWEAWGHTALHDAVAWLPEITGTGRHAKRAAVLITDGVDNASRLSPYEAREMVRQAQLPVYVLGFSTGSPQALTREGKKLYRYADVLNLLAWVTGGQYHPVATSEGVELACQAIEKTLRHQYVLGFPTRGQAQVGYHQIDVHVRGKNRRAVFRRGYHGAPPANFDATRGGS